jgi:hypothetical protein
MPFFRIESYQIFTDTLRLCGRRLQTSIAVLCCALLIILPWRHIKIWARIIQVDITADLVYNLTKITISVPIAVLTKLITPSMGTGPFGMSIVVTFLMIFDLINEILDIRYWNHRQENYIPTTPQRGQRDLSAAGPQFSATGALPYQRDVGSMETPIERAFALQSLPCPPPQSHIVSRQTILEDNFFPQGSPSQDIIQRCAQDFTVNHLANP